LNSALRVLVAAASLNVGVAVAAEHGAEPRDLERRLEIVDQVLAEVPLVDGHNDTPWAIRDRVENRLGGFDFVDTTGLDEPMQTDLTRLRAGRVGGVFWSVWVPTDLEGSEAVKAVLEQIDLVHRLVAAYSDDLEMALTAADVRRIHAAGRVASLIGAEGGYCLDDSLAVLRQLYALGVRYLTLTHWDNTAWADAATDAPQSGGLTEFGELVVREMNRLGMMVDLSHVSEAVMEDALAVTSAPVIFSHSNAAALNPHPRNVPDRILERVVDNGGVVMVNFGAFFVSDAVVRRVAAGKAEKLRLQTLHPGALEIVESTIDRWYDDHPMPAVSIADLADHVDHIRRVAGIDHVGLGSDFDGVASLPEGLEDVSGYPLLLAELLARGYSRDDLAKVAGLNVLRVMAEVERIAAELQRSEAPIDALIEDVDGPSRREATNE
jgi:membrane dipeptidase